jgi:hypothetical protein
MTKLSDSEMFAAGLTSVDSVTYARLDSQPSTEALA